MKSIRLIGLTVLIAVVSAVIVYRWLQPPHGVRGKAPAVQPQPEQMPEQKLAQELALADARVQSYIQGRRAEVFGVRQILADQFTAASSICATADCRQVEIYNFDDDAAITAIVNLDTHAVLDVLYQPGMHPGINQRLTNLALEIARNDPQVINALGNRPLRADMAPVDAGLVNSVCDEGHLCAGPTFRLGNRMLWAVVDLTDETLAGLTWTVVGPDGSTVPLTPRGCPAPGNVRRDGWTLSYATSATDGLHLTRVTYNGMLVANSLKLLEWHVDYGAGGFLDTTGCGGGGGGFPIYPYGETQIVDLLDETNNVSGFEVVQDFRMEHWGIACNYRYAQHYQFFQDGRFRVASLAFGQGCGTNALYRPVVRLNMAVNGDQGDTFAYWDGSQWLDQTTELFRTPYAGSDGPHMETVEGYSWRILDQSGIGYAIEPSQGQFGDGSRGDDPFIYVTVHKAAEGDTDLGVIGNCCYDNHQQGPDKYVNSEPIAAQNIVLWYVAQMTTETTPGQYYCWTVAGEPNPETYPCWSGPMFVPVGEAVAAFNHSQPVVVNKPVTFINESASTSPVTYQWDFGDGTPVVSEVNPTHIYTDTLTYTVRLTATNPFGSNVATAILNVHAADSFHYQRYFPVITGK